MKNAISFLLLLLTVTTGFSQNLGNPAVIGQTNRNQKVGKGFQIEDTLLAKGKVRYSSLPASGSGDTVLAVMNTSGYFSKINKSSFLSSIILENSLFPNGGKIIEDTTYEITHSDAGYLLYFPYETIVTHSIANPLIESDVIGVQFYDHNSTITMNDVIVNAYLYSQSQSGAVQLGETAIFQAIQDGEIIPLTGFKVDESDGNKIKTITRYLYDNGDYNYIAFTTVPTSSTDTGIKGQMAIDSTYLYVCVDTNTWVRTLLVTW